MLARVEPDCFEVWSEIELNKLKQKQLHRQMQANV